MKWHKLRKDTSRKEAKQILVYMQDIIDRYGVVTLADFYDLEDYTKAVYLDNKYGWHSLRGARVSLIRIGGAYRMKLPDLEVIE